MPNNVSNKLTFHCDADTAKTVFNKISSDKQLIDFNQIIQYPSHFQRADDEAEKWEEEARKTNIWNDRPKDGYNHGGYDWCRQNWGTKWNAYNCKKIDVFSIYFQTAWCVPLPIFSELARQFEYADEDIGSNAGKIEYKGKAIGRIEAKGSEAAKIFFNLNPEYSPKDCGYDPVTFEYIGEEDEH